MLCPSCSAAMHLSALKAFWVCPNCGQSKLAVSMATLDRMADYWEWLKRWNVPDEPQQPRERTRITMREAEEAGMNVYTSPYKS